MKIIKSYIAYRNWIKAHSLMAYQYQGLALVAIRKAVRVEPDLNKIPSYLELQGNIEASIGKKDLALQSFRSALEIIKECKNVNLEALKRSIIKSINEIKKDEST